MKTLFTSAAALCLSALLFSNKPIEISAPKVVAESANGCGCYENGEFYSPGYQLCLGGNRAVCVARKGFGQEAAECGWDYFRDTYGNFVRCG